MNTAAEIPCPVGADGGSKPSLRKAGWGATDHAGVCPEPLSNPRDGGPFPLLGGMQIIMSTMVPMKRVEGPVVIWRSKGHPLCYWLARQLARIGITFEPDLLTPRPSWTEVPQVLMLDNTILVHPRDYARFIASLTPGQNAA